MVKVFSPHFGDLFRAKILKNNKGCYDIFYIDYGNIETVSSNVIYELADELKKKVFFFILFIYYFIFNDLFCYDQVFYGFYPYYHNLSKVCFPVNNTNIIIILLFIHV